MADLITFGCNGLDIVYIDRYLGIMVLVQTRENTLTWLCGKAIQFKNSKSVSVIIIILS